MSIQELQPFEETLADAAAIYAVLGVPRSMMPKNEGSTYENAKADERGLYQNKVIPFTLSWCKTFTSFIGADKWGYYLDAKFDHIEALQENKKESAETNKTKIESFTKLYKDGGITHNQWLIALGYEARGTEFDKYINELENVPMAVKIGVGGTQAMQSIIADTRLTEEARAAMLVLLFGITEEQARQVVVTAPLPETPAVQPANN